MLIATFYLYYTLVDTTACKMLILSLCQQLERTQLLRLQKNENRNGKGRKSLQKWVDTGVVAAVEVLADLHQGTLTNLCYFSANVFLFF